jgi:NAD(P)-dependent dehydrogenase (short-subunit alcohol dehydrogenase family)
MATRWLEGKVAIVTGAGVRTGLNSIGRAHAVRLAEEGAHVIVNNRHSAGSSEPPTAEVVAAAIRAVNGSAIANTDDVSSFLGSRRIIECALDSFGRIDILINNAGFSRPAPIWESSEEDFDDVIAVHLKGTFNTVRHASPHFIAQKSGVIINTSSNSGQGHYGNAVYSAAKEGIIGFTRAIARDLGPHGIRANSIRPVAFSKPGGNPMIPKLIEAEVRYAFPTVGDLWISRLDRAADWNPAHIANFVAWLCTENSKALNGDDFEIHGARIGVLAPSHVDRAVFQPGGWSIEELNQHAALLIGSTSNRFARTC